MRFVYFYIKYNIHFVHSVSIVFFSRIRRECMCRLFSSLCFISHKICENYLRDFALCHDPLRQTVHSCEQVSQVQVT